MTDRARSRIGLAPDAISAALFVVGLATSLGAASLGVRSRASTDEAVLSAYARASWQVSSDGGGLSSVLYLGHLLGPMLLLASLVHARSRHREQLDTARLTDDDDALAPTTRDDAPRTLRRISLVVPHAQALELAETLRTAPAHAHRAIAPLSKAIERSGEIEHVEHVLAADDEHALEREERSLERRLVSVGLGGALAGYRERESVPSALAGDHAILSWVIVTRSDLDPLVDVPTRGRTADWLTELVPLRPEETVLVDAFVTPRTLGVDAATLCRVLSAEPLREPSGARARQALLKRA
ncbi:MAG: hypothetical protein U0353_16770 [Sandaracinus sp.]